MIASVQLAYFTATIEAQHNPALKARPFVVGGRAVSAAAAQAGIRAKMSPTRARALVADVVLLPYNHSRHTQASTQVETLLQTYSPQIEAVEQRDAAWYVGLGHLRLSDVLFTGTDIIQQFERQMALTPAVGIASNRLSASAAGRVTQSGGLMVLYPGTEAHFLAPLPVSLLPLSTSTHTRLQHLGIRTIGDFAALPRTSVLEQFGRQGLEAYQLAHGMDEKPIARAQPRDVDVVMQQFETPVDHAQTVEAVISKLARRVARQLRKRNLTMGELSLALHLDNQQTLEACIIPGQPTYNTAIIRQHLLDLFGRLSITAAVDTIIISVSNLQAPQPFQPGLFDEHVQHATGMKDVLAHLSKRYGTHCFYQVTVTDTDQRVPEQQFRVHGVDFS